MSNYKTIVVEFLLESRGAICPGCNTPFSLSKPPTIDHMIPISRGGLSERGNLWLLCFSCNNAKDSRTVEEWDRDDPPDTREPKRPRKRARGIPCICGHPSGRHSNNQGRCWMCTECREFLRDPEKPELPLATGRWLPREPL